MDSNQAVLSNIEASFSINRRRKLVNMNFLQLSSRILSHKYR